MLLSDTLGSIVPSFQANVPGTFAAPPVKVLSASLDPYTISEASGTTVICGVAFFISN